MWQKAEKSGKMWQKAVRNSKTKNKAFSCCIFVKGKGGISQSAAPGPAKRTETEQIFAHPVSSGSISE